MQQYGRNWPQEDVEVRGARTSAISGVNGSEFRIVDVATVQAADDERVVVVVCITGKTPQNAKHAIDEVIDRYGDVCQEITRIPLLDSTEFSEPTQV